MTLKNYGKISKVRRATVSEICLNPEHMKVEHDGRVYCQHCFWALQAENERLQELLGEIYNTFKSEPYFKRTGRLQIATWINTICERIKAPEEKCTKY